MKDLQQQLQLQGSLDASHASTTSAESVDAVAVAAVAIAAAVAGAAVGDCFCCELEFCNLESHSHSLQGCRPLNANAACVHHSPQMKLQCPFGLAPLAPAPQRIPIPDHDATPSSAHVLCKGQVQKMAKIPHFLVAKADARRLHRSRQPGVFCFDIGLPPRVSSTPRAHPPA